MSAYSSLPSKPLSKMHPNHEGEGADDGRVPATGWLHAASETLSKWYQEPSLLPLVLVWAWWGLKKRGKKKKSRRGPQGSQEERDDGRRVKWEGDDGKVMMGG